MKARREEYCRTGEQKDMFRGINMSLPENVTLLFMSLIKGLPDKTSHIVNFHSNALTMCKNSYYVVHLKFGSFVVAYLMYL